MQLDMEQSVFQTGTIHENVISELKATLECASGDTLIEIFGLFSGLFDLLFAADDERIFFRFDRQFLIGKASDRNRDAIIVLVETLDIVGRVAVSLRVGELIDHFEQAIETNRIAVEWRQIKTTHGISSFEATCGQPAFMAGPSLHRHHGRCIVEMGVGQKGFKRVPQQRLPQLYEADFNPAPPGMLLAPFEASDGVQLRGAFWQPEGPARGTLVVLQGRSETIEKYFETIGEWLVRGFTVFAFDWRGQGGSARLLDDPRKGHVGDFADYQRDLDAARNWLKRHDAPQPIFGFGHSMGGAILIDALARDPHCFVRAVTTAPMLDVVLIRNTVAAGHFAGLLARLGLGHRFVPQGGPAPALFKPFADNILSRDAQRHQRSRAILETTPALALGDPTIQWVATCFTAMARLRTLAQHIQTPLLGIASAHDRVTSTPVAQAFFDTLPHGEFLTLSDCEHEILIETDTTRAWFWRAFDAFMAEPEI
jgi:lysophospholipase